LSGGQIHFSELQKSGYLSCPSTFILSCPCVYFCIKHWTIIFVLSCPSFSNRSNAPLRYKQKLSGWKRKAGGGKRNLREWMIVVELEFSSKAIGLVKSYGFCIVEFLFVPSLLLVWLLCFQFYPLAKSFLIFFLQNYVREIPCELVGGQNFWYFGNSQFLKQLSILIGQRKMGVTWLWSITYK
jgi:hypothetical protein